jgi:two-component system OmpR family response regulator
METTKDLMVFIVDDDALFCKALEFYLKNEIPGLTLRVFPNGEACLHEMHLNPDVILLDYRLNSEFPYAWDGLQVLKKISQVDPGISVVILSVGENLEIAMDCINTGAVEYVVKNEHAFEKVKKVILNITDEIVDEEAVEKASPKNTPQIVGLVILIIFIIILLLKL